MQVKDYYKILGVKPSAALPEIKTAYRALANRYHPDKNPGNELSEALFKEINEAYRVLSDGRRRAAYEEARWLSGMGSKNSYRDALTPAWLLQICLELNTSLAVMDTHRMNQKTLQVYIMMILADAHLGILLLEDDKQTNRRIVTELIRATTKLELQYLDEVVKGLLTVGGTDPFSRQAIDDYVIARKKQEQGERLFPFIIIAVTLALCIFMYFYASIK